MSHSRTTLRLAAVASWLALPAGATTIQVLSDANLVDRAAVVAAVTVEARLETVSERPETRWQMVVDRVLKGSVTTGRIVVRVPGGRAPDGMTLRIYGTPNFTPGGDAIVFLQPRPDGSWALADFPQGAFLAARSSSRKLALRDFSEVRIVSAGRVGTREPMRDFERFSNWIEDRADGFSRGADYLVQPRRSELQTIVAPFTLFTVNGLNLRWFNFDSGASVSWRSHSDPMPGLSGGGATEFVRALAAWTNEPTTPVSLVYAGTSSAGGGLTNFDNQNVVLWKDINNEIAGTFSCTVGGTLAIGGPWYDDGTTGSFGGKAYIRIQGGDIVFNDGVDCKKSDSPNFSKFIEEVSAHELGHTLGLTHSSEQAREPNFGLKDALMYYRAHDDGRGAALKSDDIQGLQTLYRPGGVPGGGGGGGGSKPPASGCPAGTAPNTLCLLKGRFHVTGTWSNQFDGSSGTAMPVVNSDLSGFFYFTDPGNIELIVKILDFGSEIKVFYSQLTNLKFTLNVTDTSTGRTKSYANTPGDCGAIDQNFSNALTSSSTSSLSAITAAASSGTCVADSRTLCTLNNRFAITVDWRNQFNGVSGTGLPKKLTNLTGAFSFDDPANLEILIKTLEFPEKILVIYGSLSNFEYTIHVTDTATGKVKDYRNAAGNYCGGLDENAF